MAPNKKKASQAPQLTLKVNADDVEMPHGEAMAKYAATVAEVQAVTAIEAWTKNWVGGDLHLMALLEQIETQTRAVQNGDMNDVEAMLFGQALTLQSTFTALSRRAAGCVGENVRLTDAYLRLALKAQSQCRATLETLAEIKAPRSVAFIKQANVAQNQQVNNGTANSAPAHEKTVIEQNELLTDERAINGNPMDTRATGTPSSRNPRVEAVE